VDADLHTICHDVVEELRLAYPGRAIVETYEGDCRGRWDVDRLAQAFSNLIGNALSYADPAAPIRVAVGCDDATARAEVHSLGPTIPADTLQSMLDPLRRTRPTKTAGTKGLGLGVYITYQIILAHGGTMSVSSEAAHGTSFRFSLPVEDRHA
jgi:signal transduction histidine kinase